MVVMVLKGGDGAGGDGECGADGASVLVYSAAAAAAAATTARAGKRAPSAQYCGEERASGRHNSRGRVAHAGRDAPHAAPPGSRAVPPQFSGLHRLGLKVSGPCRSPVRQLPLTDAPSLKLCTILKPQDLPPSPAPPTVKAPRIHGPPAHNTPAALTPAG